MTLATVPGWTGLDAAGVIAEAAAVLALVVAVPWWWDRARKRRQPAARPARLVHVHARETVPYNSPAWSTGEPTGEEPQ